MVSMATGGKDETRAAHAPYHMDAGAASAPSLAARYQALQKELAASPARPQLVAVSKQQPWARVTALMDLGHRVFGENRVDEAQQKWARVRAATPELRLHMVGPLQRNKLKAALGLFDALHSLDRPSLAEALAAAHAAGETLPQLFVQVNIGDEPQKSGVAVADLPQFLTHCREQCRLKIAGLSCLPPRGRAAAPYFALLHKLAQRHGADALSMGMSADYRDALACGATHVRIGAALFGARPAQ